MACVRPALQEPPRLVLTEAARPLLGARTTAPELDFCPSGAVDSTRRQSAVAPGTERGGQERAGAALDKDYESQQRVAEHLLIGRVRQGPVDGGSTDGSAHERNGVAVDLIA